MTISGGTIPKEVLLAINLLEESGYEAYLVGGCVRDFIMGRQVKDYDVTTDAEPLEISEVFKDYKVIETGLKHGTVTVIVNSVIMEITTYRIDGDYIDYRHPGNVVFCKTLSEDLARRDFTMNAICLGKTGYIDIYGGITDIKSKVIRAVGVAGKRFEEDALRILRALRFAAVLGFSIEEATEREIFRKRDLLKKISAERIAAELVKTLLGEYAKEVFLKYYEVLGVVLPEILPTAGFNQHTKYHCYDILEHSMTAVKAIRDLPHLKLSALMHDFGKPATFSVKNGEGHFYGHPDESVSIADRILTRLKSDNPTKERVKILIKYHDTPIENSESSIKRWLNKLSEEVFFELLELKTADCMAQSKEFIGRLDDIGRLRETAQRIISEKQCFSLKDLAISGNDLTALGFSGKEVGVKLNEALYAVMEGRLDNDKKNIMFFLTACAKDGQGHKDG